MSRSSTASHKPPGSSMLHLPHGDWATVLECLADRFPAIGLEGWRERMRRGRVLDGNNRPLPEDHPYQYGLRVHYFREVADEPVIPFEARILYQDAHLVVADKPHFLPVMPSGQFVQQTLLTRLMHELDNPHLAPIHRIDRLTAGLVLFSASEASRGAYQKLFRERAIDKAYEAIAPALPAMTFPLRHRSRLENGEPFILMREVPGEPNSETRLDVLERRGDWWRYALQPVTGRRHQLRVHLAALGAAIRNDPLYPVFHSSRGSEADDHDRPLKLLARELRFIDPLDGQPRHFRSEQRLGW